LIYSFQRILPDFLGIFGDSFFLTGIFYLVLWAGLPALGAYFIVRSGRSLFEISAGSIVFWLLVLLSHLGLGVLFFELDEFRVTINYTDKYYLLLTTLFSGISILAFSIGVYFSSQFYKLKPTVTVGSKYWVRTPSHILYVLLGLGALCLFITTLFMSRLETIPIFILLGIGEGDIAAARSAGGNAFEGRVYLYNLFIQDLPPFLTALAFALHKENPSLLKKLVLFLLVGISVFGAVLLTAKGGLVYFFLILMITHYLMKGGKISLRPIFFIGTLSLILMVLMVKFVFMPDESTFRVLMSVISRALAGGHESFQYIQIFPYRIDYLVGQSFPNPGGVFPFRNYPLTIEVQNYLYPQFFNTDIQGSAPTTFWGDLYANFGLGGVIIFSPLIGFIVGGFDGVFSRIANSALKAGFVSWVIIHLSFLSITSVHYLWLDTTLYAIVITFVLLHFLGKMPLGFTAKDPVARKTLPAPAIG
jgi:oligosaccharide repeat unit polymerase